MSSSGTGAKFVAYDASRTYDWNYDHAPDPVSIEGGTMPGTFTYAGLEVASPLAVAAGPLLNGRWILYYASLGFDILTYKTVRSSARACYPMPNLVPVDDAPLPRAGETLVARSALGKSWAVSFGMPSKKPEVWRRDVEWTRARLPADKRLAVSVVGTMEEGWTSGELAADYARCARWAVECGADIVEANFSCPNVSTCDGELYRQPEAARRVAIEIRDAIGEVPLILKIGYVDAAEEADRLVAAVGDVATALAMTNSVSARLEDRDGQPLFDGMPRGICGVASHVPAVAQVARFRDAIDRRGSALGLIGVGGVDGLVSLEAYQKAGAEAVQIATAAMLQPDIAIRIKAAANASV